MFAKRPLTFEIFPRCNHHIKNSCATLIIMLKYFWAMVLLIHEQAIQDWPWCQDADVGLTQLIKFKNTDTCLAFSQSFWQSGTSFQFVNIRSHQLLNLSINFKTWDIRCQVFYPKQVLAPSKSQTMYFSCIKNNLLHG